MVKLNERKIRWIIQQKLGGRGTGEVALIQRVSRRRIEQLWQSYRRTAILPTLKKSGRPSKASVSLRDDALILEAYDNLKVNALALERVLKHAHGLNLPHNRIHMILKENGRAMPQPSKQTRRRWVRYEREHSMSLWYMDWKQLWDGAWWIAAEDDASRLIVGYGVFQEATAENTIQVLKQAIEKHGSPREVLTDRVSQFYANEGERREKGISQFEAYLAENGIKHILCRVNHPQTNGKLERFCGVYEQKRHQWKLPPEKMETTQLIQDAK